MPPYRIAFTTVAAAAGSAGGYYYFTSEKKPPQLANKPFESKHKDTRPFKLLSKEDIDNRLRAGQFTTTLQVPNVKAVYSNQLASNNPIEDTFSIHTFNDGLIAGVYDGHVGPQCARLIRHQLPVYIAKALIKDDNTENAISNAFVDLDNDIQQRFYDIFPKNLSKTKEADVIAAVNNQPDPEATRTIIDEAIHGSCALAVYVKDGVVYSANTGDSRVVIVSQDEQGRWKGRRLVEEESPANPDWRAHMISQHPPQEAQTLIMKNRVFGLIAVGGSFGDIIYKVPVEYQTKVLPYLPYETYRTFSRYHHHVINHSRTPPYLESKPLMSQHKLEKQDRFILLGTDGLWDELSWPDIRSTDGDHAAAVIMSRWTKKEANPATHLIREALLLDAVYKNVRVKEPVENEEYELSKRLTRQPSRYFRDDITVTVIELDDGQTPDLSMVGPVLETSHVDISAERLVHPPEQQKKSWFSGWIWSRL